MDNAWRRVVGRHAPHGSWIDEDLVLNYNTYNTRRWTHTISEGQKSKVRLWWWFPLIYCYFCFTNEFQILARYYLRLGVIISSHHHCANLDKQCIAFQIDHESVLKFSYGARVESVFLGMHLGWQQSKVQAHFLYYRMERGRRSSLYSCPWCITWIACKQSVDRRLESHMTTSRRCCSSVMLVYSSGKIPRPNIKSETFWTMLVHFLWLKDNNAGIGLGLCLLPSVGKRPKQNTPMSQSTRRHEKERQHFGEASLGSEKDNQTLSRAREHGNVEIKAFGRNQSKSLKRMQGELFTTIVLGDFLKAWPSPYQFRKMSSARIFETRVLQLWIFAWPMTVPSGWAQVWKRLVIPGKVWFPISKRGRCSGACGVDIMEVVRRVEIVWNVFWSRQSVLSRQGHRMTLWTTAKEILNGDSRNMSMHPLNICMLIFLGEGRVKCA